MGVILFSLGGLVLYLEVFNWRNPGGQGISTSIEEAKSRDVFVASVQFIQNPYITSDSTTITLVEGWIEKPWSKGLFNQTIQKPEDKYLRRVQLNIQELEKDWNEQGQFVARTEWSLGLMDKRCFYRTGKTLLVMTYNLTEFEPDTATFNLYHQGTVVKMDEASQIKKIGAIKLVVDPKK